ncbi:MAG: YdeI/OmpD-associated family protein, partial [Bacteroidota bacterium]
GGDFIMPLNASMRKAIKKMVGAKLNVQLEEDANRPKPPAALLECLADEPQALKFFNSLSLSHQNYFGNWIKEAKTEATQAKRIAQAVTALGKQMDFGQMVRALKAQKNDLFR